MIGGDSFKINLQPDSTGRRNAQTSAVIPVSIVSSWSNMKPYFIRHTVAVAMMVFLIAGCAGGRKPLETLTYRSAPLRNRHLIVFLRGLGGAWGCLAKPHQCFEAEKFVEAVRIRRLPFDMVAPDTSFTYYRNRTLEERLMEDIIKPAKADGYEKIWLVGVSMGGLGSLLFLKKHQAYVDGVLLLGPYLGDRSIIDEISAAGGLKQWLPGAYDSREDWQRMLWDWLKQYNEHLHGRVPIYLGIGDDDIYNEAQMLLAQYLPQDRVIRMPGGHRFSTFKQIWDVFLDKQILK